MALFGRKKDGGSAPPATFKPEDYYCKFCGNPIEIPNLPCAECYAKQLMDKCEGIVIRLKASGRLTFRVEQLIMRARMSFKEGNIDALEECISELEDLLTVSGQLRNRMMEMEEIFKECKRKGMEVGYASGVLALAYNAMEKGAIEEAEKYLSKAERALEAIKQTKRRDSFEGLNIEFPPALVNEDERIAYIKMKEKETKSKNDPTIIIDNKPVYGDIVLDKTSAETTAPRTKTSYPPSNIRNQKRPVIVRSLNAGTTKSNEMQTTDFKTSYIQDSTNQEDNLHQISDKTTGPPLNKETQTKQGGKTASYLQDTGTNKESPTGNSCRMCGKGIKMEWKLCPYCGAQITDRKEMQKPTITDEKKSIEKHVEKEIEKENEKSGLSVEYSEVQGSERPVYGEREVTVSVSVIPEESKKDTVSEYYVSKTEAPSEVKAQEKQSIRESKDRKVCPSCGGIIVKLSRGREMCAACGLML